MFSLKKTFEDLGYNIALLDTAVVESFRRAILTVSQGAQGEWIRLAQARFRSSRAEYIKGLRQAESFMVTMVDGEPVYTIQLVGDMPNNLEFGMPPYDMKTVRPGWLGGAKSKVSKDGTRYVIIPFRHSPTGAANLRYTGKARDINLQPELRRVVKDFGLDRMVRLGTGAIATGAVRRATPGAPGTAGKAIPHPWLKGLTRMQHVSETGAGSAQFLTWRIMSEKSDPGSWQHPGLEAANLLKEVDRWVDTQLKTIVEKVLREA